MTEFFVEMFKNQNKCARCKKDAVGSKSLCPEHLKRARDRFRVWSNERKTLGLCLHCDKKGYQQRGSPHRECRCWTHKLKNRQRCRAWAKVNSARLWEERKAKTLATGLCQCCAAHNPIAAGRLRCQNCLDRFKKNR